MQFGHSNSSTGRNFRGTVLFDCAAMRESIKRVLRLQLTAILASLLLATAAQASRDPLDAAFGEDGIAVTREASGVVTGLVEDRQRRIVAAGVSDTGFVLARYRANGSLDRSFEGGRDTSPGVVRTPIEAGGGAFGLAIQSDGKIVAVGSNGLGIDSTGLILARYLPDGRLDPGFGINGVVRNRLGHLAGAGQTVAVQRGRPHRRRRIRRPNPVPRSPPPNPSGLLIRYLPDGSIDRSFGTDGQLRIRAGGGWSVAIADLAVLPGGKILAAGNYGTRFLLARLLPDGSFDPSFGAGDGRTITKIGRNESRSLSQDEQPGPHRGWQDPPGGQRRGSLRPGLYLADGSIDRSFGDRGLVGLRGMSFFGAARDVVVTKEKRIVIAGGTEYGPRVLRFLPDGELDRSFAEGGIYSHSFRSSSQACAVIEQQNGRLVVGGRADLPLLPGRGSQRLRRPVPALRLAALGGEPNTRAVDAAVQHVEDDALAQAALADLQWLTEQLGDLLQQQHAGGEDADSFGVELEATGDVGGRVAAEDADAALQGLVLEHGADQAAQRGGAAADGDRLGRMLDLDPVEDVVDAVADLADLSRRGRVGGDQLVGQNARADSPGADLLRRRRERCRGSPRSSRRRRRRRRPCPPPGGQASWSRR